MHNLVLLAKNAVESYVKERRVIETPKDLPKEFLERKTGTFVTIEKQITNNKKQKILRGCVGTYLPTKENIAEETIHNAIAAATEDYRFGQIKKDELPHLSYTVYILNPPELVKDIKELNPKKYGIIVKSQGFSSPDVIFNPAPRPYQKAGLLLPDLEEVDTVEQQISICCQKGGIDLSKEKVSIYKFTVEKYE